MKYGCISFNLMVPVNLVMLFVRCSAHLVILADNPEGRPPPIPVHELIDMLFRELGTRAFIHSELWKRLGYLMENLTDWLNGTHASLDVCRDEGRHFVS